MKKLLFKNKLSKVVSIAVLTPLSLYSSIGTATDLIKQSPDLINMVDTSGSFQSPINSTTNHSYTYFDYSKAFVNASTATIDGYNKDNGLDLATFAYGLTGMGVNGSNNATTIGLGDNGALFGSLDKYNEKYSLSEFNGGYNGINFYQGITEILSDPTITSTTGYTSEFRDPTANSRVVLLFTDTNTEVNNDPTTTSAANKLLTDNKVSVVGTVPITVTYAKGSADEQKILAVARQKDGTLTGYYVKEGKVAEQILSESDITSDDGSSEYIDTILNRKNADGTYVEGVAGSFSEMVNNDIDYARAFGMASTGLDVNIANYLDATYSREQSVIETTTKTSLKAQTVAVMSVITSHFKQLRTKTTGQFAINNAAYSPTGLNAGGSAGGFALWFTPTYSSSHNTQAITSEKGSRYDETNVSYLGGVDYVVNTDIVLGAMVGYEESKADMNNGGNIDKDGLVYSLYGAYNWSEQSTWYIQGGYGNPGSTIKTYDKNSATFSTGKYDSDKVFFGLGALYNTEYNSYNITLDGGFNWATEAADKYTNSAGTVISATTTKVQLMTANVEVSKPINWAEAFVNAGVEFDLSSSTNNPLIQGENTFGGVFGGGLRFNPSQNLFGEIAASYNVFRAYQHGGYNISATLRYTF